jgi:ATP-binding cassette subfamily B (MDR/TAP) protein 6
VHSESIKYNIAYGDPESAESQERVVAAAKAAQIHDRILTFPDQYETKVGVRRRP